MTGLRLGVYADIHYGRAPEGIGSDTAFVRFIGGMADHVDRLVVFGRLGDIDDPVAILSQAEAEFVALPDYRSLARPVGVVRAFGPSRRIFREHLADLDAVWLFGPHPMSLAFARDARRRGLDVVLGVRQDFPKYLSGRVPPAARPAVRALGRALEHRWRTLARRCPTVVTGSELRDRYRRSARLIDVNFSLVDERDVRAVDKAEWSDDVTFLSVGRLDPEKNPLLLAEVGRGLASWRGHATLRVVGDGSLRGALRDRVALAGIERTVELVGQLPQGPALQSEYDSADAFVHVSSTEGVPQVLFEAMAAGLPIVATAIGGVSEVLGRGSRGLLVPPGDAPAILTALDRLRGDPDLRRSLVAAASDYVGTQTRQAQAKNIAQFLEDCGRPLR